jgi:serine/threonine protein kinase
MQDPLPPKASLRNGRYIVESLYKRGGQALVYRGHDSETRETVIIKQNDDEQNWSRKGLRHEAELLAQLSHPSLPRVIDTFEEQGNTFLVMSYVPGRDLGELMRSRGREFTVAEVMGWAEQLLDILDYLQKHDAVILHRDINPKNIRLTPDNRLFLLDFGIAKRSYSKTLLVGGTPHFAPPEQLRDEGTDHRSDIYSLAATLYCLLTAVEPPDSLSRASATLKGLPDPLVPAQVLNSQIPAHISRALLQAMSLEREDRPFSILALRRKLRDEDKDYEEEEEIKTVVSQRRTVDAEATAVSGKELERDKSSKPIVIPFERAQGRDATPEALQLLDALRHVPPIPDDLIQTLIEFMDSPPELRPRLLKRYARLLNNRKADSAHVVLNFIDCLHADCYLEPNVKAQLRQQLGRLMAEKLLAGLSSSPDEERGNDLVAVEDMMSQEKLSESKAHRKRLRTLLIWITRGAIIATAIQVGFQLLTDQTLLDILLSSSGHRTLWANLFLCAYTVFLFALIRQLSGIRPPKNGYALWLALLGLGYGLTLAGVLLQDLFALIG